MFPRLQGSLCQREMRTWERCNDHDIDGRVLEHQVGRRPDLDAREVFGGIIVWFW